MTGRWQASSSPLRMNQRSPAPTNRKPPPRLRESWFRFPFRKLKQVWLPPEKTKPTPSGVGFLLDVVPPGLEPGTP